MSVVSSVKVGVLVMARKQLVNHAAQAKPYLVSQKYLYSLASFPSAVPLLFSSLIGSRFWNKTGFAGLSVMMAMILCAIASPLADVAVMLLLPVPMVWDAANILVPSKHGLVVPLANCFRIAYLISFWPAAGNVPIALR